MPARVEPSLADAAVELATRVAAALGYVGTIGVELFVCDGALLVNEIAPRPHNSGHYTLDACTHEPVRAAGASPVRPAARRRRRPLGGGDGQPAGRPLVRDRTGAEPDWAALLAIPGLRLHLYGKTEARPGRKMGHVTVVADDPGVAIAAATAGRAASARPSSDTRSSSTFPAPSSPRADTGLAAPSPRSGLGIGRHGVTSPTHFGRCCEAGWESVVMASRAQPTSRSVHGGRWCRRRGSGECAGSVET